MKPMSYKDIIKNIGKPIQSTEIASLFKRLGTDKFPELFKEYGYYQGYATLNFPELGLYFTFELPKGVKPRKENEKLLILNYVAFCSKSTIGNISHSFSDPLPYGITFSDLEKDVFKKAGKPTKFDKDRDGYIWTVEDLIFMVNYKEDLTVNFLTYEM